VKQLQLDVKSIKDSFDTKFITKEEFETYKKFFWIAVSASVSSVVSAILMFFMTRK
jgi:hypothetical protein